jgi:glucose dehydrogenase
MVTAINAETGREMWQKPAGGDIFATPAIASGLVFVATNAPSLVAFDLTSGRELWRRGVGGQSSPAIDEGTIFLGSDDQSLRAINAETGEVRWSSPLGYAIRASATVSGDDVFIGSGPTLNAVSRSDGSILWTQVTGGDVSADMVVVGDRVIATSHDGYVYALGPPQKSSSNAALDSND